MATLNNQPRWVHVESVRRPDVLGINLRVAIRAHEGWIPVLDFMHDELSETELPTSRQVLENIQETVAIALAKLTLEEV